MVMDRPVSATHRALAVPELLNHIFSYLPDRHLSRAKEVSNIGTPAPVTHSTGNGARTSANYNTAEISFP